MWKNYFKIAWRSLWQSRGSTLINVGGLSIALSTAILVFLWSQNELRFNDHYADADRIYLKTEYDSVRGAYGFGGKPQYPAFGAIKEKFLKVEQIAMLPPIPRRESS